MSATDYKKVWQNATNWLIKKILCVKSHIIGISIDLERLHYRGWVLYEQR